VAVVLTNKDGRPPHDILAVLDGIIRTLTALNRKNDVTGQSAMNRVKKCLFSSL